MPGGSPTHRTVNERAAHRRLIADMWLQRRSVPEMAEAVGVSMPTVFADLKFLREEWIKESKRDFGERLCEDLAETYLLERTYWEGWKRSVENSVRREATRQGQGDGASERQRMIDANRVGDPSFLQGVERQIEARRKILGYADTVKVEVSGPGGTPLPTSTEAMQAAVTAGMRAILENLERAERGDEVAPADPGTPGDHGTDSGEDRAGSDAGGPPSPG